MELKKLLDGIVVLDTNARLEYDIKGIKISSKEVCDHDLFLCMQGTKDNGNNYISSLKCDCVVMSEKRPKDDMLAENVKYIVVEDVRKAYSRLSQNYFENPLDGMKFVAIVGTNGKTSTAHYISSILNFAGVKTGLIGTEGHFICGEKVSASLTTPDPFELNELFFKMRTKGVEIVISEVSAHAIYLEKLYGIKSDLALLTNITQDHLDFFKTFENYCGVKMSYFSSANTKKAIINIDDKSGFLLAKKLEKEGLATLTYGIKNPADCFAIDIEENIDGVRFVANISDDIIDITSGLFGEFNVYNLLLAITACHELGIDIEILMYAVKKVRTVKGRFSILRCEKGIVIIDYAHTPDGLKNLLTTARTLTKSRILTVFGCGGERDKSKRKLMGEVASTLSDFVVATSDNPRFEDPESILHDIESGFCTEHHKTIVDRSEAIQFAISQMWEGDTLVIAGKGNENYLDIRGKKVPYNDFETVCKWGQIR